LVYVNLNDMTNLCRVCAVLVLRRLQFLSFWIPLMVILSRFCLVNTDPVQASNIIILDTPRGDFIEVSSSSYNLSLFSSKTGSHHDGGAGATPRESLSVSIGDLWPEIDSSHRADHEVAVTTTAHSQLEASTSC
jgi:hypothetical protein